MFDRIRNKSSHKSSPSIASTTNSVPPAPSLTNNDLLQQLKAVCAEDSALQPLLPILTLAEPGQPGILDSFNLINLLIKFVRTDHSLRSTFKHSVPEEINKIASAHADPSNDRSNKLAKPVGQFDLLPSSLFAKFKIMFEEQKQPHPAVFEADGRPMWHIPGLTFRNWGLTVSNSPADSFVARTVVGVQNLIKWAKTQGKTVRLAGYRHTWAYVFPQILTGKSLIF